VNEPRFNRSIRRLVPILAVIVLIGTSRAQADPINLLTNGDFSVAGTAGSPASFTGQDFFYDSYNTSRYTGAPSAAASWGIWNNTYWTTLTELLPSTFPGVANMIHVVTDGTNNGLLQSFLAFDTGAGPGAVLGSVAVYVLNGQVGIGTGNGLYTGFDGFSSQTGEWQVINATNGNAPANDFLVYSANGPAEFYAAAASVSPVPEPATLMLVGGGALAAIARARRRRGASTVR
jgi:PEP-CTERM motif-containing protein